MKPVVVGGDDLRAVLVWFDETAGEDWTPTPPTDVLISRDRLWRAWNQRHATTSASPGSTEETK